MEIKSFSRMIGIAFISSVTMMALAGSSFFLLEPTISQAAVTDTFTIRQQITDEISFLVPAADVTMVSSIQGISGGHATGTTFAVVRTNSASGYTMDIAFSGNPAMQGEVSLSSAIRDYGPAAEPTFAFNASTSAQFAYTVSASTTSDLDPSFLDNGTTCNTGAGFTANACWKGPTTSNFRIVNRGSSAPSGATTSLTFRITVPSNPVPSLVQDFYTATATLTATNQ